MDVRVALRVIRGPNWSNGDQDGGEGYVGSVVSVRETEDGKKMAVVVWDSGCRGEYSCGVDDKYSLRVQDNSLTGEGMWEYVLLKAG